MNIEAKLQELGIQLPDAPKPVATYVPGVIAGEYLYVSGQLPSKDGSIMKGKLGEDCTENDGYKAARQSAINNLAVAKSLLGDLDRIEKVVKVVGFVNSTPDFDAQPKVINGASDFIGEVFGNNGQHARSAVGVNSLPLGACVEVEMIFKLQNQQH